MAKRTVKSALTRMDERRKEANSQNIRGVPVDSHIAGILCKLASRGVEALHGHEVASLRNSSDPRVKVISSSIACDNARELLREVL